MVKIIIGYLFLSIWFPFCKVRNFIVSCQFAALFHYQHIKRNLKAIELKKIRKVKQLERKAIQIAKEDLAALEVKTQQLRDFLDGQIAYTLKRTLNAEAEAQRRIDSLK